MARLATDYAAKHARDREINLYRDEDYLDGYSRGRYKWLLDLVVWRFHLLIGLTPNYPKAPD